MEEIDRSISEFQFSVGEVVKGYVVKVDSEWVWLTVARNVMAHLFFLDTSCEPKELQKFQQRFSVGQAIQGRILTVNKEKKLLRLSVINQEALKKSSLETKDSNIGGSEHINRGDIVGGRIKKILPGIGGILVQIGPHLYGRAHYSELQVEWVPQPLNGYEEGQFVKCRILDINRSSEGTVHVDLSLRSSSQGINL